MPRAEPAVLGPVASDPTLSRLIDALAGGGKRVPTALRQARAHDRQLAGRRAPDAGGQATVGLDGVLVIAQSEKQDAAATWKEAFGYHPLTGFVDHGAGGSGEPVVGLSRPGNADSVTGADHIEAARPALAQLPKKYRCGRRTLIRCDDGARVAEPVGDCLKEWPMGARLIVCKEGPHPGAQLRYTDADGMRLTRFATNTKDVPIAEPEPRHRQRV